MVSVLQGVMEEGWGTGRGLRLDNGMPCAGKTGTTDEAKDGWFCGFTHYYTTAVWVGCDTPESVRNLQGASWPGRIWKNFMNIIHEDLEPVEFKDYDHAKEDRALKDQESSEDDWYDHEQTENAATKKTTKKEDPAAAETTPVKPPQQQTEPQTDPTTPEENAGTGTSTGSGGSTEQVTPPADTGGGEGGGNAEPVTPPADTGGGGGSAEPVTPPADTGGGESGGSQGGETPPAETGGEANAPAPEG